MAELPPSTPDTKRIEPLDIEIRNANEADTEFIVEMVRYACVIKDRPLPDPESKEVARLLPSTDDIVIVAVGPDGNQLGAAWTFHHSPPLLRDDLNKPLPEMAIALEPSARGIGTGSKLIEELASQAKECFSVITLNVHSQNPALKLYLRSGFKVVGAGRGKYGVAMRRKL